MIKPLNADIAIIGSGLVGLTLAAALAETDWRIVVLDKAEAPPPQPSQGFAPRVSAITPGSEAIFKTLNIWSHLENSGRLCHYQDMIVWDASGHGLIHFDCENQQQPHLGTILENALLQRTLFQQLTQQHENIEWRLGCQLTQLEQNQDASCLHTASGEKIHAKLVVGADGAHSWLRQQCQLPLVEKPYGDQALVCHVQLERPHQQTAYQCFTPTGPLAFLPLAEPKQCSIVWSSPPAFSQQRLAMDDPSFCRALGIALEHRLGMPLAISKRYCFPLVQRHAKQYVRTGIALIGDAAHTIHPLAGQGVNLGIADAICLANTLKAAQRKRLPFANYQTLRRFERTRKADNALMIASMQGFRSLFASQRLDVTLLRNLGLQACNRLPWLKQWFIESASSQSCS